MHRDAPERITKKWLAIELGYYWKTRRGDIAIDYHGMQKHVYTPELIENVLGLTYERFSKIRKFDTVQTRKILEYIF